MSDESDKHAHADTAFVADVSGLVDSESPPSAPAVGGATNMGNGASPARVGHSGEASDRGSIPSNGPSEDQVKEAEEDRFSEVIEQDPDDPLIGQVLAGRYRIVHLLGAGGMGAVYRARHVHMRKDLALKVLHREMTAVPEVVARFEREAVAAARIDHPNVATATDFGVLDDGAFYLVLEYVEGRSLSKLLEAEGPLDSDRAVHIARQIAEALAAAHAAGIVHRDLKPDNVMLVDREGDVDFVKVLDFGIAKVHAEESNENQPALTQAGSVFGTPEYMSPEQAKGESVDARSDLYTVGMILYEMLAGKTAFASDELIAILTKHMTEPPPPLPDDVPWEVSRLVMKLLEKEPDQRYQTAGEVVRELASIEIKNNPSLAGGFPSGSLTSAGLTSARLSALSVPAQVPSSGAGRALARARRTLTPIIQRVSTELPVLLRRPVPLGGRLVPLWWLATPATLLVMAVAIVLLSGGSDERPSTPATDLGDKARQLATAVLDPELAQLMKDARAGDRDAIAKLRKRAEKEGGVDEWRALGRGYAEIHLYAASAEAYGKAIDLDADLVENVSILEDLRAGAEDRDSYEKVMTVAVEKMRHHGADLIYAVYHDNLRQAGKTAVVAAAKRYLDDERLEKIASPALKVALDLSEARACSDYKELLPTAVKHADERSLKTLKALRADRGCGFLGLKDCYSCLRTKDAPLREAIEAAESRPSPGAGMPPMGEKPEVAGTKKTN